MFHGDDSSNREDSVVSIHVDAMSVNASKMAAREEAGPAAAISHSEELAGKQTKVLAKKRPVAVYDDDDDDDDNGELPACLRRGHKGQPTCGCVVM